MQKQPTKKNAMTTLAAPKAIADFSRRDRLACQRLAKSNAHVLALDFENGEPVRVLRTVVKAVKIGSHWRVVLNKPLPTGGQCVDRSLVSDIS